MNTMHELRSQIHKLTDQLSKHEQIINELIKVNKELILKGVIEPNDLVDKKELANKPIVHKNTSQFEYLYFDENGDKSCSGDLFGGGGKY